MKFFKVQLAICESGQHGPSAFCTKIDSEEMTIHPCRSIALHPARSPLTLV